MASVALVIESARLNAEAGGEVPLAGMVEDRLRAPWGSRRPYGRGEAWPERVDTQLAEGVTEAAVDRWVSSACVLCSNGCGLEVAVKDDAIVGVRGRPDDRINRGRLGPKGLFGWQANGAADRLTAPLVRREGRLVPTDWDDALGTLVERMRQNLGARGPGSIGIYTSGQLFLEEYYTLAVMARAGIGTNHLDGNTRLCTATAGQALKETFGCDGQPGSYADIDECDTLFLVGHNVAATETVLWSRILDRRAGPQPPTLIVVDPRRTPTAEEADLHVPVRAGTNVAFLNAVVREMITNDWIDEAWVRAHTIGFDDLVSTVETCTADWAARVCDVDRSLIVETARLLGRAERLVSTALQGVYQSHQATASACQVNNINLLRGMIGEPGRGVLQMNGQPTAQNTRECGADGDLPGFRNWQNDAHVQELARLWNVDPLTIPHWGPPTHAMEIFRYAEQASISFLWIIGTNPAVSLPDLHRVRSILADDRVFVVVQDAFLTETAMHADLVLPAALWGEKTGTFTNTDRTVHLSEKAVDPPSGAWPDLDIFLDVARRMDFRDKDGQPLIAWSAPEEAFAAWQECSKGRPCEYTDITYDRLRTDGYAQWGGERLYTDHVFCTDTDIAEDWGHDLLTGAPFSENEHRALHPAGRAILKAATYIPPHEEPDDEYPFALTTGRSLYHFHTRTKTGRSRPLRDVDNDVWAELSASDAARLGVRPGDVVDVISRRGSVRAPVRVCGIREGTVFVPFHFGYWDTEAGATPDGAGRAANELTMTVWDPVSKQPTLKNAAVQIKKATR